MGIEGALALISNDLRERIDAAQAELVVLQTAIADWQALQDAGDLIPFGQGRLKTLLADLQGILQELSDLNDQNLVELIWRLRQGARACASLLVRSERLLPTLERVTGDFSDTGGRPELANLPHRKLQSYMVHDGDTPQSIMQKVTGQAERWIELVVLNGLDYPYITDDDTFDREHSAVGTATFCHEEAQGSDYTIPAGTLIETVPKGDSKPIQFVTTAAGTIIAGELCVEIPIEAVAAGEGGNIAQQPGRIVRTSAAKLDYALTLQVICSDVACNEADESINFIHRAWPRVTISQTCGGAILNVRFPAELIYVPVDELTPGGTPAILQRARQSKLDALYGVDYWFSEDGELARDQTGDIRMARGLENLAIALRNKVMTRHGDVVLHRDYGCELHQHIGELDGPPLPEEVVLLLRAATESDPRVEKVDVEVTEIRGNVVKARVVWTANPTKDVGVENLILQT